MGRLSLFAIGITELRDMFSADPDLAGQLRDITARHFPAPADEHRQWGTVLGRLGPLLKRPIDRPEAPARPTPADGEALLAGRTLPPERLGYAWQIALAWLDEMSWGRVDLDIDPQLMEDVEFDLARAGLSARLGLERLFQDNPQLPLLNPPHQRFGYAKNRHVEATRQGLSTVVSDLSEESLPIVGAVLEFCNQFAGWSERAAEAGRPVPDLVAVWMP